MSCRNDFRFVGPLCLQCAYAHCSATPKLAQIGLNPPRSPHSDKRTLASGKRGSWGTPKGRSKGPDPGAHHEASPRLKPWEMAVALSPGMHIDINIHV